VFQLEKHRLQRDLIAAFQYLMMAYWKDGKTLFRPVAIGQGVMVLNYRRAVLVGI